MTIEEIENAIESVVQQNQQKLANFVANSNGYGQVDGVVNGNTYTLGIRPAEGRNVIEIGQFYPE